MKTKQITKSTIIFSLLFIFFAMLSVDVFAQKSTYDLTQVATQIQNSGLQVKTIVQVVVNIILTLALAYVVYLLSNDKSNGKEALMGLIAAIVVFNVFMAIV